MKLNSKDIGLILNDSIFIGNAINSGIINHLTYDTRKINDGPTSLFFALSGQNRDGHRFIMPAYQKGVRHFVISNKQAIPESIQHHAHFYLVKDTLQALRKIAQNHRSKYTGNLIGIIGSNGKTIVKEWISHLMPVPTFRSPMSYNSQLGVAVSLSRLPLDVPYAIIEAGISEKGEMVRHAQIMEPDQVVFTTLGSAHQQNFNSTEEKLQEKFILANNAKIIFCSSDQAQVIDHATNNFKHQQIITWGSNEESDLQLINTTKRSDSMILELVHGGKKFKIEIPFIDDISKENCLHALNFILYHFGWDATLQNRLHELKPISMRLEILDGINECKIINDSYVSDLYSLQSALSFQKSHAEGKKRTLIISELDESQLSVDDQLNSLSRLINSNEVSRVITLGTNLQDLGDLLAGHTQFERLETPAEIVHLEFRNECILIKGSRIFKLEQLVEHLEKRAYTSRLEINLSAVQHNVNYFKSKLASDTRIMAVLKASAYGSGSVALARLLESLSVSHILVALIDEGIELRKNGITLPIVVLNPDPYSLAKLFNYNLEAELYSLDQLEKIATLSRQYQSKIGLHVNIDTGMNRLGFQATQLKDLIHVLNENDWLEVKSIFSHLTGSESEAEDISTQKQYDRFMKLSSEVDKGIGQRSDKHILNSSGILRFPDFQLDMVRLGLGLHGIDSHGAFQSALQKVHSLISHILQIKDISAGESIGYNQSYVSDRDMKIAILNIGYADGLNRKLSNENWSLICRDQLAPIIGKISMDLTVIDVSHIIDVEVGDEVIVFDENHPIELMAQKADTIPYEILTGIPARVKRLYYWE